MARLQFVLISFMLLLFINLKSSVFASAQSTQQNDSVSELNFNQADIDEKHRLIQSWLNISQQVTIDAEIQHELTAYYQGLAIHPKAAAKYNIVYKTLYNEALPLVHRLNYCTFILENYTEEEVSWKHIQQIKMQLMQGLQKK